ncbi:MAG: hypothetical protein A2Y67_03520 [Candidatus Buchananbacteria bacterium RBG_13_39_9]|uniref:Undecaprenyl-phosphate alpha-N-acetylglucosaminyl 1-phosphate transferase n=1 Tax=Candidatus Buchananbacteria bacterium RBG_13_39_9 TaxID=1797531 RepID=A0A1G1XSG4_9BACT|nr:MAG: hypothetical protein A2Y67_03520 [Candidatus Buchananbacteria bacterium RBG_13_39_9]
MINQIIIAFAISFLLSIILTLAVRQIAIRFKIFDLPNAERKIHQTPIPLLGGIAVFLSFALALLLLTYGTNWIIGGFILPKHIWGIISAGLVLIIGGALDDIYNLKPKFQIIFPVIAALIIISFGIGISHVRNPFGGIISFLNWQFILFWFQGIPYKITLFADLFTLIWLMGMMHTTKLLDGLDGLVSGITAIASLIIFAVSLNKIVAQPNTALMALILAGAFAGFLIFNWHPAKIFLGESGSLFAGLMIGVLAIISGSKVATTLLIMGIPILDVLWIIIRRIFKRKKVSIGDSKHLHFRLLDVGFSQRQAVLFLYSLTALFGLAALFLQTFGKLIAMIVLSIVMIILAVYLVIIYQYKKINFKK